MYKLITFLFGLNLLNSVKAQDTLTFKDGQRFPSKKLISSCISQARKSKAPINAEVYCDCMIKLSAPYLTIAELKNLISNGNNESNIKLFEKLKKEVPNEFEDCALSSAVNDRTNWPQSRCDLFYQSCLNGLQKDTSMAKMVDGIQYCNCVLSKVKNNFTSKELLDIENNPQLMAIIEQCLETSLIK